MSALKRTVSLTSEAPPAAFGGDARRPAVAGDPAEQVVERHGCRGQPDHAEDDRDEGGGGDPACAGPVS